MEGDQEKEKLSVGEECGEWERRRKVQWEMPEQREKHWEREKKVHAKDLDDWTPTTLTTICKMRREWAAPEEVAIVFIEFIKMNAIYTGGCNIHNHSPYTISKGNALVRPLARCACARSLVSRLFLCVSKTSAVSDTSFAYFSNTISQKLKQDFAKRDGFISFHTKIINNNAHCIISFDLSAPFE